MKSAVAWVGLGLIAGALVWAAVTVALYAGYEETGVDENALVAVIVSCLLGLIVLAFGARWRADAFYSGLDPDLRGAGCVVPVLIIGAVAATLFVLAHPEHMEGLAGADPSQIHVWLTAGAVTLGVLLIAPLAARPSAEPLARTLPAFAAGLMVVVVAGTLVHTVLYAEVRHTIADDPGEAAPVPESVTQVGWEWEPEAGTSVDRVEEGTHGPLVVLSDGVVSLDGTDGSEIWSFRRPYARVTEVAVDGERVVVTHEPAERGAGDSSEERADGGAEESTDTGPGTYAEVLDAATGDPVPGLERIPHPSSDDLTGSHVARTSEEVFHADTGEEAEDDTVLSSVEAASGEEQWSASVPAGEGRVCEGGSVKLLHGLVVSTHVCEDEDDFEGEDVGYTEDREPAEVEHVVAAVDPDTGEQVWDRTRTGIGGSRPPDIVSGGPVAENTSPVILLESFSGGAVLDPATGKDAISLPAYLDEDETHFEGFIGADSESATYLVDRRDGNPVFERVDPRGEVVETAGAGDFRSRSWEGSAVALDLTVLTSGPAGIDGPGQPLVHMHDFGEPTGPGSDPWMVLDSNAVPDPRAELLPLPGAVVAEVGDEGRIRGLVP